MLIKFERKNVDFGKEIQECRRKVEKLVVTKLIKPTD